MAENTSRIIKKGKFSDQLANNIKEKNCQDILTAWKPKATLLKFSIKIEIEIQLGSKCPTYKDILII